MLVSDAWGKGVGKRAEMWPLADPHPCSLTRQAQAHVFLAIPAHNQVRDRFSEVLKHGPSVHTST